MTPKEIEQNLQQLVENLTPEDFIFDFLLAFGFPKASVSRLKSGDYNQSKIAGEILYKGKIFFKVGETGQMLIESEVLAKDERILKQKPRFILLTDFKNIVAKDLKTKASKDFPIEELPNFKDFFIPLTGAEIYRSTNDNKADREASYALARFYDIIVQDNPGLYEGESHGLNILLSRLLFCFFAEDTGIFETAGMFTDAVANNTAENGSDLHLFFKDLFAKLNSRKSDFPNSVKHFPYVNGGLFKDEITLPKFSKKSRDILIESGNLNWDEINPDIFGSMIQAVADPEERSDLGMHYTSVPNILKLIKPLFLDELYEEFENNRDQPKKLEKLLTRLSTIKFFDPACGSGNFLIITYKELRLLEIKIIQQLIDLDNEPAELTINAQSKINFSGKGEVVSIPATQQKINFAGKQAKIHFPRIVLSQFYGIEIKDFAHEMAILSLWLAEHQMNKVFEEQLEDFGQTKPILPLKESGQITLGNAATFDWEKACPKNKNDEIYIIGNPPYLGSRKQKEEQKKELEIVFKKFKKYKDLDYISIWILKSAQYLKGFNVKSGLVSTNSICQGEQVALLWPHIFDLDVKISYAYSSFKWINNAKGNAGVTVIIIGLENKNSNKAILYDGVTKKEVDNINAYLIPTKTDIFIEQKNDSISKLPKINHGNMPADGGKFLFNTLEKGEFVLKEPKSEKWFKKLVSAREFLNGRERWCLWLENIDNDDIKNLPEIAKVINQVREIRLKSSRPQLAEIPHLFAQITQPENVNLLIIPRVSSENREYLPIDLLDGSIYKVTDSYFTIATNEPYLFGVINSKMHMVWVHNIGGRLETRIQYSKTLCYNTFPFPPISIKQKEIINQYVFAILDERAKFPQKTMAWLYNPETMPKDLLKAHQELDQAIERIYRIQPFSSDAERLEYLFKMYDEMTKKDTLWAKEKKTRKKKI